MKVLGIYGSPRQGGNSDILLDQALEAARAAGAEVKTVYVRDLDISGCLECGGCDETGQCVVGDDMDKVYPLLEEAQAVILATPIFFYNVPAQAKALIDRTQACWAKRLLKKGKERGKYEGGRGYLIAVGATKGQNLFQGVELTAKYFFDAMDMSYHGGLMHRGIEGKGSVGDHPEVLEEARQLGRAVASGQG
ncbi:MAG: flavodoxin family protein [Desulfarculus sp.]|nr:flavodoxin family protein [Desulfarculus sp.]